MATSEMLLEQWEGKFTIEHHLCGNFEKLLSFYFRNVIENSHQAKAGNLVLYGEKQLALVFFHFSDVVKIAYTIQIE